MRPVSESVAPATLKRTESKIRYPGREPIHRHAGPAYEHIRIHGSTCDPRDRTRAKVPSIRFQGTDEQLQEIFDKGNHRKMVAAFARPSKFDVKIYKLERRQAMAFEKELRELQRKLRIAETIQEYAG